MNTENALVRVFPELMLFPAAFSDAGIVFQLQLLSQYKVLAGEISFALFQETLEDFRPLLDMDKLFSVNASLFGERINDLYSNKVLQTNVGSSGVRELKAYFTFEEFVFFFMENFLLKPFEEMKGRRKDHKWWFNLLRRWLEIETKRDYCKVIEEHCSRTFAYFIPPMPVIGDDDDYGVDALSAAVVAIEAYNHIEMFIAKSYSGVGSEHLGNMLTNGFVHLGYTWMRFFIDFATMNANTMKRETFDALLASVQANAKSK